MASLTTKRNKTRQTVCKQAKILQVFVNVSMSVVFSIDRRSTLSLERSKLPVIGWVYVGHCLVSGANNQAWTQTCDTKRALSHCTDLLQRVKAVHLLVTNHTAVQDAVWNRRKPDNKEDTTTGLGTGTRNLKGLYSPFCACIQNVNNIPESRLDSGM